MKVFFQLTYRMQDVKETFTPDGAYFHRLKHVGSELFYLLTCEPIEGRLCVGEEWSSCLLFSSFRSDFCLFSCSCLVHVLGGGVSQSYPLTCEILFW